MADPRYGNCRDCAAYEVLASFKGDASNGTCRRHPPHLVPWQHPEMGTQFEAHQPGVSSADGCFDFIKREPDHA
jgi:hypothetical protein